MLFRMRLNKGDYDKFKAYDRQWMGSSEAKYGSFYRSRSRMPLGNNKYCGTARSLLTILDTIVAFLLAMILFNILAYTNLSTDTKILSCFWFFVACLVIISLFLDRKVGEKLHKFFAGRFLKKIWKSKNLSLTKEEKLFLKEQLANKELTFIGGAVPYYPQPDGRDRVIDKPEKEILNSLLKKDIIIEHISPYSMKANLNFDRDEYIVQRWAWDYMLINKTILD